MTSVTSTLSRHLQIFSVLRYRNFRLYWIGLVSQVTGQQMTMVTTGWLAFHLTGSPLTLGIVNLAMAIPRIIMTLVGGVLADRLDQRRLITYSQSVSAILLVGLAALVYTDQIEVWHLVVGSFLIGFFHAFDEPSRQALFPHLLPDRSLIARAVPVNSIAWQVNRIVAPGIAGFVIAAAGADMSFLLAAVGAGVMAALVRMLHIGRIERAKQGSMLHNMAEGARYVWSHMVFRMVVGMAFVTSVATMGYQFMMPVFAADVFEVDARGLGVLLSATGAGSILSVFTVYRLVSRFRPGKVLLAGAGMYAVLLAAFSVSPTFYVALVVLAFVGYFQMVWLIGGEMVLQMMVPDQLRGRVMGLYGMLWSIMPISGALLNSVADFTGARLALLGGSLVLLFFVLLVGMQNKALRDVARFAGDATAAGSSAHADNADASA